MLIKITHNYQLTNTTSYNYLKQNNMRKAKSISELLGEAKVQESKGIEFEYSYSKEYGKKIAEYKASDYITVIHLGYCIIDETDFFLASDNNGIVYIFSGKLNDGTY